VLRTTFRVVAGQGRFFSFWPGSIWATSGYLTPIWAKRELGLRFTNSSETGHLCPGRRCRHHPGFLNRRARGWPSSAPPRRCANRRGPRTASEKFENLFWNYFLSNGAPAGPWVTFRQLLPWRHSLELPRGRRRVSTQQVTDHRSDRAQGLSSVRDPILLRGSELSGSQICGLGVRNKDDVVSEAA